MLITWSSSSDESSESSERLCGSSSRHINFCGVPDAFGTATRLFSSATGLRYPNGFTLGLHQAVKDVVVEEEATLGLRVDAAVGGRLGCSWEGLGEARTDDVLERDGFGVWRLEFAGDSDGCLKLTMLARPFLRQRDCRVVSDALTLALQSHEP